MSVRLVDPEPGTVEVRDEWIPMPDGVRLHARLWLPAAALAEQRAVPALLEYLPYRLDDWTSVRDSERHPYYAAHGYASVRVDIRGTGSSEGLFEDEYSPAELDDGETVIAWLAAQPWCTGAVGMFGISWGGFNSLQLAARAPESLRAVVTVCSTDDRYDNDVHYVGGAVLGIDMTAWAATMFAFASRPPRPEVVGGRWVDQWRERLERQRPLAPVWLGHQERDEYWRRGSVCEDYGGIEAAVLAVGGWADPYHDTVLRLLESLPGQRKGILGPWAHQYPDRGYAPGPGIGFLQETLRWWDRWLKDLPTGVEEDPDLRVWIHDSEPPSPYYAQRRGRWLACPRWAGPASTRRIPLASMAGPALAAGRIAVRSPLATGQDSGRFFPFGNRSDLPPDQRAEDGRSVCFDLPVGQDGLTILGSPVARLRLSASTPRAHVIVRLCDVAPDGSSTLVTRGVLNLVKRHGMERCDPLQPGEDVEVSVRLVSAGHRFTPGHRLRFAVSNHYWPWVWPHPEDGSLSLDVGTSVLELPLAGPVGARGGDPVAFEPAEHARPLPVRVPGERGESEPERYVRTDVATGETVLSVDPGYGGSREYPDGLVFTESAREVYRITEGDPTSASAESSWRIALDGPSWAALVETSSRVTATAEEFVIENRLRATATGADGENEVVTEKTFIDRAPRTSA